MILVAWSFWKERNNHVFRFETLQRWPWHNESWRKLNSGHRRASRSLEQSSLSVVFSLSFVYRVCLSCVVSIPFNSLLLNETCSARSLKKNTYTIVQASISVETCIRVNHIPSFILGALANDATFYCS
ncbi:hypothetical protein PR202_ga20571 [Eleusine coracana subsp. coracana]|uniref:Uncharacterized protein n=1 Tax=Eleusine coracana subsp. coracana TaxID=191504 RepID=A0AAV5CY88_ELECO|nr:hypothetical protein PR202_ga20571 [Eleusine coracana subsp. coracana]